MATIEGTVQDAITQKPIENASVVIAKRFTQSDENGNFSITNIPTGLYRITILHRLYKKLEENLTVSGDMTGINGLEIRLAPE